MSQATLTDAGRPLEASPGPRAGSKRVRLALRVGLCVAAATLLVEPARVLVGDNLHAVVPGAVYRSAQPSPAKLKTLVERHGIRTVINLRGACPDKAWHPAEAAAAQRLGVTLIDLEIPLHHLPSPATVRRLVRTLETAQQPILMHCRRGADRTGLASAVALLLRDGVELDVGTRQLGLRFGHVPFGSPAVLGDFFDDYRGWLARNQHGHDHATFRRWLLEEYRGAQYQYAVEEATRLTETPRVGLPVSYRVRLKNTSPYAWNIETGRLASYHVGCLLWHGEGAAEPVAVGLERCGLRAEVIAPGGTLETTIIVPPLHKPGRYRIRIDMVDRERCWFADVGATPFEDEFTATR